MRVAGEGLSVDLLDGWDVRIGRSAGSLLHGANFALPPRRGDFGSGAVDIMGPADSFVTLFEFGVESVGQPLFAAEGMPRDLDPDWFDPTALQRPRPGHAGLQRFFTEEGRAFCLYVVLGSYLDRRRLAPPVSEFLAGLRVATG